MALVLGPPTIHLEKFARILELAEPILSYIPEHEDHQHGGIFCIADHATGTPLLICAFGAMTDEEYAEYVVFALEKAKRLAGEPLHFTSSQSRDMTTTPKRYGGAIRGKDFILSFSGFKEEQDEGAMLALELKLLGGFGNAPRWLIEQGERHGYFSKLIGAFWD